MSLFVISKTQEFLEKGFFLFVFLLNLLSGFVDVFFWFYWIGFRDCYCGGWVVWIRVKT